MYTHIIFDLDGTLLDSRHANRLALDTFSQEFRHKAITEDELTACFGLSDADAMVQLGIPDTPTHLNHLRELCLHFAQEHTRLFSGVRSLVQCLTAKGVHIGIVTSESRTEYKNVFCSHGLAPYFEHSVCSDDTADHKPNPAPLLHYLSLTGASAQQCLYIGDAACDSLCATAANIDFGLAEWGSVRTDIPATFHFSHPHSILSLFCPQKEREPYLERIIELQMLAQAGLAYSKDPYDIERFRRIRTMTAEMLSEKAELSPHTVEGLFCADVGYPTPKLDSRAAIFDRNERILLVHETAEDAWALPGGWVDANLSVSENLIKEVKEEAGLDVRPTKFVSLCDRNRHNTPPFAYGVAKAFLICEQTGGSFTPSIETDAMAWFSLDELPANLSLTRNTSEQIALCFLAHRDPNWQTICD